MICQDIIDKVTEADNRIEELTEAIEQLTGRIEGKKAIARDLCQEMYRTYGWNEKPEKVNKQISMLDKLGHG